MIADIEELERWMHQKSRRLNALEVFTPMKGNNMLCSPYVPDIHRLVHIAGQCSCTLLAAPLLMRAWHSLHITIKAQTQKHIVHWTHLLRAFPFHNFISQSQMVESKSVEEIDV